MPYKDEIEVYGDEQPIHRQNCAVFRDEACNCGIEWKVPERPREDLAQFIAEELFESNQSAISAIADMIRPVLAKWNARNKDLEAAQPKGETMPSEAPCGKCGAEPGEIHLPECEPCPRCQGLEKALREAKIALEVIRKCLKADDGDLGEYWSARQWLDDHNRYHDNLQGVAVPLEVSDWAVAEAERVLERRG